MRSFGPGFQNYVASRSFGLGHVERSSTPGMPSADAFLEDHRFRRGFVVGFAARTDGLAASTAALAEGSPQRLPEARTERRCPRTYCIPTPPSPLLLYNRLSPTVLHLFYTRNKIHPCWQSLPPQTPSPLKQQAYGSPARLARTLPQLQRKTWEKTRSQREQQQKTNLYNN